jgi:peptidoglycan/LPS O-acetylase OafA/YrhL
MNATTETNRFIGLDGLRGIAALAVFSRHVSSSDVLPLSYLAVDVFFMLSGFVLTHAYQAQIAGGLGLVDFMRLRLVRLYPLYLLGTLIAAALTISEMLRWHSIEPMAFVVTLTSALLFLPTPPQLSLDRRLLYPLDGPAWSLFFELLINVVFVMLLPHLNRFTLAGVLALGLGFLAAALLAFGGLDHGTTYGEFFCGVSRVTFSFFAGVALYHVWLGRRLEWVKPPSWLPMLALLCVFAVPLVGVTRMGFEFVACVVLFPAIVLACANTSPSGIFARTCMLLGAASYAVYVLQVPIIHASFLTAHFLFRRELETFGIAGTVVVTAVLFATALVATTYDARIRRWVMRKSGASRRRPVGRPADERA